MSLAILDARQWQQVVDLRTGKKAEADTPTVGMVREVLARHPFPGDTAVDSNPWVTDTALDLIDRYDPRFVFLTYARQYYSSRYGRLTDSERQALCEDAFAEMERFSRESGFMTVAVGTGDLTPVAGAIDLCHLDGLAVPSNWSTRYAGLYGLSDRDLAFLDAHPRLERIASKAEILALFEGGPHDGGRLPDYMAVSREGWYFKGSSLRRLAMVPARNATVPVSASLGPVDSLTDVRQRVLTLLQDRKVALVFLEGVGHEHFRLPRQACANGRDWYCYEPGDAQYLALTSGGHRLFRHNGGYRYYLDDDESKQYPFSGYFTGIPTDTIGFAFAGKSIAVGNRSMFMHVATGCDVTCECFARNLYNQGSMAVIHREKD